MTQSDYRDRAKQILEELKADEEHGKKRLTSFACLDYFIDCCLESKQCPPITPGHHHYLIDISLEGYIMQRAYYYSKDGIGIDDNNRYLMSKERVERILNCADSCNLQANLFLRFLTEMEATRRTERGIRVRKAYWTHLKFAPHNNPITDFEGACGFIESFHQESLRLMQNPKHNGSLNLHQIRSFVYDNLHITNGFELFQFCLIKSLLYNR